MTTNTMEHLEDGEIVEGVLQRRSDDNPQVALRIMTGNDGDIHLSIVWIDDDGEAHISPATRFCCSGTRSHNMLLASREMRKAMLKDCGLWTPEMEQQEQRNDETSELMKFFWGDK